MAVGSAVGHEAEQPVAIRRHRKSEFRPPLTAAPPEPPLVCHDHRLWLEEAGIAQAACRSPSGVRETL